MRFLHWAITVLLSMVRGVCSGLYYVLNLEYLTALEGLSQSLASELDPEWNIKVSDGVTTDLKLGIDVGRRSLS